MSDHWYRNAVIYGVDIGTFMDSDGDGIGDLAGLTSRLDYLEALGVTCLWLLPFFPTPNRDNGYDVRDFFGVDDREGDLGDFVELLREAHGRGMRVLLDLVVEHTSDQHPWFQAARSDPASPYREYYIWVEEPAEKPIHRPIFPDVEDSVWHWDEKAAAYYFHTFYHFQPSLNHANPRVREEVKKILGFWLQLGVDGFRIDAASHLIEPKGDQQIPEPHAILREYYEFASRRRGGVVLLGESDVEPSELADFFGDGDELTLLMNFLLNNYLYLALARRTAEPLVRALRLLPHRRGQWTNFLRNLDEVDLERLTLSERKEVYRVFAPRKEMRIYGRGIRRRLAPMLQGDQGRVEQAFSLLFSLPGTPLLVYGDEIGMGEDLSLPERESVRTPMQWSDEENAGFSTAAADRLAAPIISSGRFSYRKINVSAQERQQDSLLARVQRIVRARKECPEFGWGDFSIIETADPAVFAHRCTWGSNTVVAVHNLGEDPVQVALDLCLGEGDQLTGVIGEPHAKRMENGTCELKLERYGYRWLRLKEIGSRPGSPDAQTA